ncbi:Conserved oligomeric Golgi complex subunit 3 [Spathaspora sp. JA1]|nr:Conserved oligomeric Golgi complex subunit 3 [Spathaspora sp. JA1]
MTRGRSKSIVQKIANDVPSLNEDLNLELPASYKLTRSKSWESTSTTTGGTTSGSGSTVSSLFPLTSTESKNIWSQYIETYEYDMVLKPQDITNINNHHLNTVLNFQNNLSSNHDQIVNYIEQTDSILHNINNVLIKYNQISNDTIEFDQQANNLLELQQEYQDKYTQISTYLKHFDHLDSITKHLSKSGTRLLHQQRDFFINDLLTSIDESLLFINNHVNFKQAELYGSRFRQCMTRGLTLIRNYLISELNNLSGNINKKLPKINIDLLIYNEFNNYLKFDNGEFNLLFNQIVIRSDDHQEYTGLLREVMLVYFNIRLGLLNKYITSVKSESTSLVQTCQDQISYFKKIIDKEVVLFDQFFVKTSFVLDEFYQFLKDLLEPLYDGIRLLVLKETNISNLCQLTTLLQQYYEFEEEEVELIQYSQLFQPILDDVQTRLMFKIQKYVDEKLIKYKPKLQDLKLIGNRKTSIVEDSEYSENLFPEIYLPLGKALTLLSNIYQLINSVVFDDLAHYIVHSCIQLLKGQYLTLAQAHMGKLNGNLSYLNNLIILKSQINNFDIQFITRSDISIDFTSGFTDIWTMIQNRNFNMIELVKKSVPKVINNMIDANLEIELELNNIIMEIITFCSSEIETDDQSQFKHNLIVKLPVYYQEFKNILEDVQLCQFLMNNLSNVILSKYEQYYNKISDDQILSQVMEVDVMYGFINDLLTHLYEDDGKPEFKDVLDRLSIESEGLSLEERDVSPGTKPLSSESEVTKEEPEVTEPIEPVVEEQPSTIEQEQKEEQTVEPDVTPTAESELAPDSTQVSHTPSPTESLL